MGRLALPYFPAWYGKTLVTMITVCCSSGFLLFGTCLRDYARAYCKDQDNC
jgi:hypothetical protein